MGHTWTAFCGTFCMQEHLPKVGVLLACLWQMHKLQIHKLVSRRDHLNISTMYSVLIEKNLNYYHIGEHF